MTTETVTLIAACMAAIASISGVGLTAWLNRRSDSLRWMRTEGRPLFARFLAASTTHIELMGDRAQIMNRILISQQAGGQGDPDDWTAKAANEQELLDAWKTLEGLYAELQVSAPSQVVKAAHYLMASGHM